MKIVVYWEDSDEESTAKKTARYLLAMVRKRGMPKAEILVRSVGAGLADEAQRLAGQMEAAFGEHKDQTDPWTFEAEVRQMDQTRTPGWKLADLKTLRNEPNPLLPQPLPKGDPGPALPRMQEAVYLRDYLVSAKLYGIVAPGSAS